MKIRFEKSVSFAHASVCAVGPIEINTRNGKEGTAHNIRLVVADLDSPGKPTESVSVPLRLLPNLGIGSQIHNAMLPFSPGEPLLPESFPLCEFSIPLDSTLPLDDSAARALRNEAAAELPQFFPDDLPLWFFRSSSGQVYFVSTAELARAFLGFYPHLLDCVLNRKKEPRTLAQMRWDDPSKRLNFLPYHQLAKNECIAVAAYSFLRGMSNFLYCLGMAGFPDAMIRRALPPLSGAVATGSGIPFNHGFFITSFQVTNLPCPVRNIHILKYRSTAPTVHQKRPNIKRKPKTEDQLSTALQNSAGSFPPRTESVRVQQKANFWAKPPYTDTEELDSSDAQSDIIRSGKAIPFIQDMAYLAQISRDPSDDPTDNAAELLFRIQTEPDAILPLPTDFPEFVPMVDQLNELAHICPIKEAQLKTGIWHDSALGSDCSYLLYTATVRHTPICLFELSPGLGVYTLLATPQELPQDKLLAVLQNAFLAGDCHWGNAARSQLSWQSECLAHRKGTASANHRAMNLYRRITRMLV